MKTLPSKPSELVELAILDLKAIEQNPNYLIDMDSWHVGSYRDHPNIERPRCLVCLAGAVMAQSLGIETTMTVKPWDPIFDEDDSTKNKLEALDSFRSGDIYNGITHMCPEFDTTEKADELLEKMGDDANIYVPEYDESKESFYKGMEKVLGILKEHDL